MNSANDSTGAVRTFAPITVGLLVAYLGDLAPIPQRLIEAISMLAGASEATSWACLILVRSSLIVLAIVVIVLTWERLPLRSIGIHRLHPTDFLLWIAGCLVILIAWLCTANIRAFLIERGFDAQMEPLLTEPLPIWYAAGTVITNPLAEEIGTRAYTIERLTRVTGRLWIAGIASFLGSVLFHIPAWGVDGALARIPTLGLLVGLYVWRRNLLLCVLVHAFADAYPYLIWPQLPPEARVWLNSLTNLRGA
jgi:membrane protease YdiL (CAAX protease family)